MTARPFTLHELAEALGHSVDWIYRRRNLEALYGQGMPRPIAQSGHPRWERSGMEAWLLRHHPKAMAEAANDQAPAPEPQSDRGWSRRLADAYR
jgi:predicted DNA-binding transcriptional regulator AlpA